MANGARRTRRAAWAALAAFTAAGLLFVSGCRSLDKGALEERLHALVKNAPIRSLERRPMTVEIDGEPVELELVHLHAPALEETGALPVVLVHGTPSTLFTWVETIFGGPGFQGLRAGRDVWAIEVAGHGVAPGDLAPYTFERCARYVAAAIRELGAGPVHLVGSSYGGEFVWRAALDDPGLVASLVLIDSSGYRRRDTDWLPEEVQMRENGLADLGWLLNSRERIEAALAPHFRVIPPDRVEEFFLVCENADNWKAMIDLARDENGTREAEIPDIGVPTLVLWGADDVAYPLGVYGERFAADVPGARLVVLPDTGHYPHEERPAEVVEALERFFAGVEERR